MRTKSLLVSLVALSSLSMAVYSGCASTTPSLPEQANAPRLAARVMTPSGAKAVAILCLGPVAEFYPAPMLELEGWAKVRPLSELLYSDRWGAVSEE